MFFCGKKFAERFNEDEIENVLNQDEEIVEEKTNIIEHGEISTRGLFELPNGVVSYENNLMGNDMTWDQDTRLYYKVIETEEVYNKYKDRIEVPELNADDLKNNYLIIVANENIRESDEIDLLIYDVVVNENTTEIIVKQKENPSPYSDKNVFWAVVNKDLIKDSIDVKIVHE